MIKAELKGKTLTLTIDLETPTPSASGKTLVVASTRGNMMLDGVKVDGKNVVLGLNAYIPIK